MEAEEESQSILRPVQSTLASNSNSWSIAPTAPHSSYLPSRVGLYHVFPQSIHAHHTSLKVHHHHHRGWHYCIKAQLTPYPDAQEVSQTSPRPGAWLASRRPLVLRHHTHAHEVRHPTTVRLEVLRVNFLGTRELLAVGQMPLSQAWQEQTKLGSVHVPCSLSHDHHYHHSEYEKHQPPAPDDTLGCRVQLVMVFHPIVPRDLLNAVFYDTASVSVSKDRSKAHPCVVPSTTTTTTTTPPMIDALDEIDAPQGHVIRGQVRFHSFVRPFVQWRNDRHELVQPDFSPILRLIFEDSVEDLELEDLSVIDRTWTSHSAHSVLHLEILKCSKSRLQSSFSPSIARTTTYGEKSGPRGATCVAQCQISQFEMTERRLNDSIWLSHENDDRDVWKGSQKFLLRDPTASLAKEPLGFLHARVEYHEPPILSLLYDVPHPDTLVRDTDAFNPTLLKGHLARFDDLLASLSMHEELTHALTYVFEWESPIVSIAFWCVVTSFLYYAPFVVYLRMLLLLFLTILVSNGQARHSGSFRRSWIENARGRKGASHDLFRPLATCRVIPLEFDPAQNSPPTPPTPYVRMYYEPGLLGSGIWGGPYFIGQTATLHTGPFVWGGSKHSSEQSQALHQVHRNWLKHALDRFTTYGEDAVLHDVIEPWPRKEEEEDEKQHEHHPNAIQMKMHTIMKKATKRRDIDVHALKYPILQPLTTVMTDDESQPATQLLPWTQARGFLRFDVMNDHHHSRSSPASPNASGSTKSHILGQVRIPLSRLIVTNEGHQPEHVETYHVVPASESRLAMKCSPTLSESQVQHLGQLRLRVQMCLPTSNHHHHVAERLHQEAVFHMTEYLDECRQHKTPKFSLLTRFHQIQDIAAHVQNLLGQVCSTLERVQNLVQWAHPAKSALILSLGSVLLFGTFFVPLHYIGIFVFTKMFTRKLHRWSDTDGIRIMNFLSSLPSALDMKKIFYWQNQAFEQQLDRISMQVKLQADWTGDFWKKGEGLRARHWSKRYGIVRNGRLEYWQNQKDAASGLQFKHYIRLGSKVDSCTPLELKKMPKDIFFGMAIYDAEKVSSGDPSVGHRRLISFATEEEKDRFSHALSRE